MQHVQDEFGPMTVNDAIQHAQSLRGWIEQIAMANWLSEAEVKNALTALEGPDFIKDLFPPSNEQKHSVSRGKKHLRERK